MERVRQINDELAIAGSVTFQQLQQLAKEGFQSVLSLRSPDNSGSVDELHIGRLGLCYVNLPIEQQVMNPKIAARVLNQIDKLPKPTLVYCNNATLAAAMVLMHIAMRQGESLSQAFRRAENLGLFATSAQVPANSYL